MASKSKFSKKIFYNRVTPWFFEFWLTIALAAAVLKSAAQLPVGDKSVLITGCDTGFGLVLAKHLHGLGFRVFAGCLLKKAEGPGAKELEEVAEKCQDKRMSVLQLDVTKDEDWDKAFELVNEVGNFVVM